MRGLVAVVLATTLFASAVSAAPLSAGKPAGVKNAQAQANTVMIVGGVAVVGLGIGLVASNNGNGPTTTTTSTAVP